MLDKFSSPTFIVGLSLANKSVNCDYNKPCLLYTQVIVILFSYFKENMAVLN